MAETALGGWVRLAARSMASVRPSARSRATILTGRPFGTLARIRARASATASSRSLFIVHSPVALDKWLVSLLRLKAGRCGPQTSPPKTRSDSGPGADNNRSSIWTKQLAAEWHKAPAARYPENAASKSRKHLAAYSEGLLRPPENWPIPNER